MEIFPFRFGAGIGFFKRTHCIPKLKRSGAKLARLVLWLKEKDMGKNFVIQKIVTVLIIMGLSTLGAGNEGWAASKKFLSLGVGNPAGTFYFIGAGFANIFNKNVPEVRVIAESTASSEENFNYILRKKMDLALVSINVIETAVERKMDLSGIRLIALGHTSDRHWIVRKDSPIQRVADFRGKRVAVGPPGSGTLLSSKAELQVIGGLTFNDFKPAYLSQSECVIGLKDNSIDVGVISAGYPVASILDLARHLPIRLIPYTKEEMRTLIAKHPYFVNVIIPAGTYIGVDTDTLTRGVSTALFCRTDLNEDVIYRLIKALYEHPKERDAIHPQARKWNLDNIFNGAEFTVQYIPFHPGAVKYLKEKGVWKGKS
jgi:TRAP transporter TAXI family solute receptor